MKIEYINVGDGRSISDVFNILRVEGVVKIKIAEVRYKGRT